LEIGWYNLYIFKDESALQLEPSVVDDRIGPQLVG